MGAGGLFSTASDYGRFCLMLLRGGALDGRRYLSPAGYRALTTVSTGDLPTGYSKAQINHVLGWGLERRSSGRPARASRPTCRPGPSATPGRGGTAAWIDPVRGAAYVMMVQRPNMPDNFENPPALAFVAAAEAALGSPSP